MPLNLRIKVVCIYVNGSPVCTEGVSTQVCSGPLFPSIPLSLSRIALFLKAKNNVRVLWWLYNTYSGNILYASKWRARVSPSIIFRPRVVKRNEFEVRNSNQIITEIVPHISETNTIMTKKLFNAHVCYKEHVCWSRLIIIKNLSIDFEWETWKKVVMTEGKWLRNSILR